ncbi:uncharacterized protein LOC121426524 isoform X4 [Lytechinus variegatus]|uniref:uncharacterized protein LOC121426524 isoform X3 n=1 Tax=Lytechinus variegatus TaxID=7654 RepID=UPI001BB2850D|nr:uncharacterized protein LOC121426524 isoform X3 [Lytechinus variegatus]XP_041478825.1 uncharacterized protein LOC121426524 isoform X4 [Lytechinus variegatus]
MNMEKIIVFLVVVAMVVSVDPTSAPTTEMTTIIVTGTSIITYTGETTGTPKETTSLITTAGRTDKDTTTSPMTASTAGTTGEGTSTSPMTVFTAETTDIDTTTSPMTASTASTAGTTGEDTSTSPMTVFTAETTDIDTTTSPITTSTASKAGTTGEDTSTSPMTAFTAETTDIDTGTATGPVDERTVKSTMATTPTVGTTSVLTTVSVQPTENHKTEAKTEQQTEPLKVGPIPEAILPNIDGDFDKTYKFEIAIEENSTKGCTSDNLTTEACRIFKSNVTLELEALYGENSAFVSVDVTLRNGSVIVSHIVTYSYNLMSDEERKMSAQDVYDDTIGKAVENGRLGNYAIEKDCGSCSPHAETSDDICSRKEDVTCTYGSSATCETGYWICESKCISDGGYCNGGGICWQEDINKEPICSCDWANGEWYWGYKCQHHVDQTYLIIGCSCGGAVLLVLLVSIIGYLYAKTVDKSEKTKKSSVEGDDVINAFQNNGFVNGTENIFPPIDDIDDGDILQRRRPYSYIYHKGDDPTDMTSSSFITKQKQNGGVGHEGKRESGLEVIDDSSKRHSQSSNTGSHQEIINSEFWGNSAAEHVKLEPFLTNADDSDDGVPHPNQYKIQRPRISNYYSFGNNEVRLSMDPSGYQGFPEPDYGQR